MQTSRVAHRAEAARWQGALDLLRLVRRRPGVTRSAAARVLGLSSGSAAEIVARLRALHLVDERPVPPAGRGRPTTALHACRDGPLVAVANIRHEEWQVAVADLEGNLVTHGSGTRAGAGPAAVIATLRTALAEVRQRYGVRVRAISAAVAGTVSHGRLVQASTLGWREVDLGDLQAGGTPALPLLIGNDATLAGVAEARRGTASTAATVLYLTIEVGVGGVFLEHGRPVTGGTGAGGEFGHLPLGDPALACPCGAHGCWDLAVDGRAMARHRKAPPPPDPWHYAAATLAQAATVPSARRASERCATAFGRGAGALVNALDPELVCIGGLAVPLREAAPEALLAGYTAGLMSFRRATPPPVRPASLGARATVLGAAEIAFDTVLTEPGLGEWSRALRSGNGMPR